MNRIAFTLNGQPREVVDASPNLTLLQWLRGPAGLPGTKEGCAEGDCGACTVILVEPEALGGPAYRAVNACLVLLPMVHGRAVYTVEGLADGGRPHPAQAALIEQLGSQCGYCTPGVVMSMFEACYRTDLDEDWKLDDQMCGNLCRCTGYRPIRDAARQVAGTRPADAFSAALAEARPEPRALSYEGAGGRFFMPEDWAGLWAARAAAPDAVLVNGGTDVCLRITKGFEVLPALISLEALAPLRALEAHPDGSLFIGAGVHLSDLEAFARDHSPAVERMLRFFGARQIKNRGTVGGNLCNASPIGDLAPIFLALGAVAHARGPGGARTIPLDAFFTGYRQTALAPDEILEAVSLPAPPAGDVRVVAYKVSKRQELDISAVSAGLWVRLEDGVVAEARFAFGGMAATPARAARAEALALGKPWTEATARAAAAGLDLDFAPLDDHRGSAWYRGTVAKNLLVGFFLETEGGRGAPRLPYRPTGTVQVVAS
ncbi:MAG: xanthine dehydrogenase small subunit [Myxococcales bacterium]|nr:xanthine dehydrogenase small subunit [Myxococcales bacterium]